MARKRKRLTPTPQPVQAKTLGDKVVAFVAFVATVVKLVEGLVHLLHHPS